MCVRSADEAMGSRTHITNTAAAIVVAAADAEEAEKKR